MTYSITTPTTNETVYSQASISTTSKPFDALSDLVQDTLESSTETKLSPLSERSITTETTNHKKRKSLSGRPSFIEPTIGSIVIKTVPTLGLIGEESLQIIKDKKHLCIGRVKSSLYQKMQPGNLLNIRNRSTGEGVQCRIVSMKPYGTFEEMVEDKEIDNLLPQLNALQIGKKTSIDKNVKFYQDIPEAVKENGIMAIEITYLKDLKNSQL